MRKGKVVGHVWWYSYNERTALSLVDPDVNVGEELTLVWVRERRSEDDGRASQAK
jgi:hypothetical protein